MLIVERRNRVLARGIQNALLLMVIFLLAAGVSILFKWINDQQAVIRPEKEDEFGLEQKISTAINRGTILVLMDSGQMRMYHGLSNEGYLYNRHLSGMEADPLEQIAWMADDVAGEGDPNWNLFLETYLRGTDDCRQTVY